MTLRLPMDEYKALCKRVLERDGWKCQNCGFRNNLHVHHIVYRSHNGEDTMENLITVCNLCHDEIHAGRLVWEG